MLKFSSFFRRQVVQDVSLVFGCALVLGGSSAVASGEFLLKSPDRKVEVAIIPGKTLTYSIEFFDQEVVLPSTMGISVEGTDLGLKAAFSGKAEKQEIKEHYATRGVHTNAVNHCMAAVIPVVSGDSKVPWFLEVRVFNDAVAYRYRVPGKGVRHINGEASEWSVPVGSVLWSQNADNTSYESRYEVSVVGQLPAHHELMAPATLKFPNHAGYGMMTEANLVGYSDLSLKLNGDKFDAFFRNNQQGWESEGEILSPWRVTLLARDLNQLVNSDVIRNLCPAPTAELANASWIRPGRSLWHWLTGGAPKLEQQKSWIDGAKQLGYEYYLVDDGWRDWNGCGDNAWKALDEVVGYAKTQQVDIWAWVNASYVFTPKDRMEYFKRAKSIGVVGLKIDFPKPANSQWVQWYDECLSDAAAVQLMVDFHGAVKPTGRERTWPHEMTREAVAGREQGKNPAVHDTTLPFLRYVQGPADYTPTLLIPDRLNGSTYAHELAMAIVYTSPYLCMGDSPKHYAESEACDVLKALPSMWDETIVLPGSEVGQIAGFARRHGDQWFIGVINGVTPRRETLDLSFLGEGKYRLVELTDNRDRNDAFTRSVLKVCNKDKVIAPLRRDGGYVAWITRDIK